MWGILEADEQGLSAKLDVKIQGGDLKLVVTFQWPLYRHTLIIIFLFQRACKSSNQGWA